MTKDTYFYTYHTVVNEWNDATPKEMVKLVEKEMAKARLKNYNLILTGKHRKKEAFFEAFAAEKLTKDFTWLHICPQNMIDMPEEKGEERFYILSFTACARDGLHI